MNENIVVKVGADISDLSRGLRAGEDQLKGFSGKIGGISTAMAGLAVVGVGALTAGIGKSISKFVDFDNELRKAGAIAGASTEEFDKMKEAALDLGASTSKSASEVATAMTELAAKGLDANEVIAAMPGIISAAEASGEDLALAADTVSSALNIFGLEASESSRVADVLAESANTSAAGIDDLGYVLKYAGAPAAALGISLEEVAAAAGIMTNAGLDGSNAGTALRASLLALNEPAAAQAKIMEGLGFSMTDSSGKTKGLSEIVGDLTKSMEGMTEAEKVATLSKLVGTEAVSGFLALVKAGPTEIDKMSESLRNSAGASQEAAEKMKAGIGGALEQLSGTIETLAIKIGDKLAPYIQDLATYLSEINVDAIAEGFGNFITKIDEGVQSITTFLEKWSPLIAGITSGVAAYYAITGAVALYNAALLFAVGTGPLYIAVTTGMTAVTAAFGAVLAFITSPIFLVVAAIALLVAAGVYLYQNWDTISAKAKELWTTIKTKFEEIKTAVTTKMTEIKTKVSEKFSEMKTAISEKMTEIKNTITEKWNAAKKFFTDIDLKQIGKDIIQGLINGIASMGQWVISAVSDLADLVPDWVKKKLGIKSPSRVLAKLGMYAGMGLSNGLDGETKSVAKSAQALANASIAKPTLSYATPSASYGSLSSALSGSVDVSATEQSGLLRELIGAVREGRVVEMDGKIVTKIVGDRLNGQISGARRNGRG